MSDVGLVHKTIWILRTVAAHPQGIGLSDVARACGIPKATCHRILTVLEKERWLTADPTSRRFRVSLSMLFLVGGLLDQESVYAHAQNVLKELAADTRETAGLDQLVSPSVVVLTQVAGPFLMGLSSGPRRKSPAWRTSTGKALLAWHDAETVRSEFVADIRDRPARKFADFDAFLAELGEVRERGYSVAYDELEEGAAAVAAPVHVGDTVPYAIWVGGPTYRVTREQVPALADQVIAAAGKVGQVLEMSGRRELPVEQVRSLPNLLVSQRSAPAGTAASDG
jgi:IclR family acetate operon transcriptional repressor